MALLTIIGANIDGGIAFPLRMEESETLRRVATVVLGALLIGSAARAGEDELEAGFRNPPKECRPAPGWFLSKAFADVVAKCPDEVRPAF